MAISIKKVHPTSVYRVKLPKLLLLKGFKSEKIPLRYALQLLPNLHYLKSGGSSGACVGAIQDKLESMAGEVARVMDEQLQV